MSEFIRSHPLFCLIAVLAFLLVYGYFGGLERPEPYLTPTQLHELEENFTSFTFAKVYADRDSMDDAATAFTVRGAGWGVTGKLTNSDGHSFCIYEISIPRQNRDMVVVFRYQAPPKTGYEYVDHFIIESATEDELIEPRRTIQLEADWMRFLSGEREYKSRQLQSIGSELDQRIIE